MDMNTEREKIYDKFWKIKQKGAKREKKDLNYTVFKSKRHKEWPDEKNHKIDKIGHPHIILERSGQF